MKYAVVPIVLMIATVLASYLPARGIRRSDRHSEIEVTFVSNVAARLRGPSRR